MASEASRAPGRIPQTIECELTNDLVNSAIPGDVVVVSGIVKLMVDENSRERKLDKHCKKKRCFTEPSKKVSEISKSLQRGPKSQKTDKKIYETFKGSSRVSRGRTFSYETFRFRTGEKGL
jgi:DNA helicase MCM8